MPEKKAADRVSPSASRLFVNKSIIPAPAKPKKLKRNECRISKGVCFLLRYWSNCLNPGRHFWACSGPMDELLVPVELVKTAGFDQYLACFLNLKCAFLWDTSSADPHWCFVDRVWILSQIFTYCYRGPDIFKMSVTRIIMSYALLSPESWLWLTFGFYNFFIYYFKDLAYNHSLFNQIAVSIQ